MALRRLAKDPESANGGCPTVYADDSPTTPEALVLQGHAVEYGPVAVAGQWSLETDSWISGSTVAWRSRDGATVTVQGTPLTTARASELENVLPHEDAVPVSRDVLFNARTGEPPDPPAAGQVRLTIKSCIVEAARVADHGDFT